MRFITVRELLSTKDFTAWDKLEAWQQLAKGHVLECLLALLLGLRVWYPSEAGYLLPDLIDRHGRHIQVKGMSSGIDWMGSIRKTVENDCSNFFTIVSLNRGKLFIFLLTKEQFINYLESNSDAWRLTQSRLRLQRKQILSWLLNKDNHHRMFQLKDCPYELLNKVQAYAVKANNENRIK